MPAKRLTLQQRQEIFFDLVMTQDVVLNVPAFAPDRDGKV